MLRKQAIGSLVHSLISSINVKINEEFQVPLLCWSAKLPEEPMNFLKLLKDTVSKNIIKLDTVQASTFRGGEIILSLFEAISNEPEIRDWNKKNIKDYYEIYLRSDKSVLYNRDPFILFNVIFI